MRVLGGIWSCRGTAGGIEMPIGAMVLQCWLESRRRRLSGEEACEKFGKVRAWKLSIHLS